MDVHRRDGLELDRGVIELQKKLPVFQQKLVPVPAFPDNLIPFVEGGRAVG